MLNVGGGSKKIPIPQHYAGWDHVLLDINPALAAGLHAVLLHHPHTWILEHEVVNPAPAGQRFLELNGFASLLQHF